MSQWMHQLWITVKSKQMVAYDSVQGECNPLYNYALSPKHWTDVNTKRMGSTYNINGSKLVNRMYIETEGKY